MTQGVGFPAALNTLFVMRDVFAERGLSVSRAES